MSRLALYLLGPPRLELDGEPVQISRRKVVALLAYLAVTGIPHSRDALATLLSPGFDQAGARADLRRTLSLLNRILGEGALAVDRETVRLSDETDPSMNSGHALWLDVGVFRERLAACEAHDHPAMAVCPDCVALLEEATGLYRDDFMAGFTLPDSEPFEDWQRLQTVALQQDLVSALERLVRGLSVQGEDLAAITHARRWSDLDPTNEAAHRELMALYARTGQTSAALGQYRICAETLAEELGIPPGTETQAMYARIRTGGMVEPDNGTFEEIEPARVLVEAAEVPIGRSQERATASHNLPPQPTPFIGRERELVDLRHLLAAPEVRLITIVGMGGMGKTRLALAAAERELRVDRSQTRFPDGVYFVPLARLNSSDQMVSALAEALGFRFEGRSNRTPQQQLLGFLREKQMLLVLDSLENLLGAFPSLDGHEPTTPRLRRMPFGQGGKDLVVDILESAPALRILATSRERLQLREEQVYAIQGLGFLADFDPDYAGRIADYAAARLFLQSAGRARHDFTLAADDAPPLACVCRLVEGMPLALELAATWVDALSLTEIADEVGRGLDVLETEWRDVPERHRSIRAAFDASWRHLSNVERDVFAQLSVFRGGFTRVAARAVVDTGTGVPLSYRVLARLVSRSLLYYSQTRDRYDLHELLRQYGAERLGERTSETRDRHSAYYCDLLEGWGKDLHRARQAAALDEIAVDLENVRSAWGWAAARGDAAQLDQALDGFWYFFWRKSIHHDDIAQLQLAIDALGQVEETSADFADAQRVLARATIHQAHSFWAVGRGTLSTTLLQRAKALLDGPVLFNREATRERALLCHRMRLFEQALPLYRSLGDRASEAWCLMALGLSEEGLAIHRELENHVGIATALFWLGDAAFRRGDYVQAKCLLGESVVSFRGTHSSYAHFALARLADVRQDSGDQEIATRMYEECLASARAQGHTKAGVRALHSLGALALLTYDAGEARQRFNDSLALSQQLDDRRYSAPALAALGHLAQLLGESETCLDYAGQSLSIHREDGNLAGVAIDLGNLGAAHWLAAAFDEADAAIREGLVIARERQQRRITAILTLIQCQMMMCVARYSRAAAGAADVLPMIRDERVEPLLLKDPADHGIRFSYLYAPPRYGKTGVIGWAHGVLGWAALAQGEYARAKRSLREGVAALREAGDREYEAWVLAALGATALGLGERAKAQRHLRAALKTVVEIRAFMPLLHLISVIPLLWADAGEAELKERAIELYALASNQPFVAKSQLFDDVAGKQIAAAAATLPPYTAAAAQERGRARDLWVTAEELLLELSG